MEKKEDGLVELDPAVLAIKLVEEVQLLSILNLFSLLLLFQVHWMIFFRRVHVVNDVEVLVFRLIESNRRIGKAVASWRMSRRVIVILCCVIFSLLLTP